MDEIQEAAIVEANLDALPDEAAAEAILQAITGYSEKAISIALRRLSGGGGGPQTVYVGDDDPGAVGAGKLWVDTLGGGGAAPVLRMRNGADDDWDQAWGLGASLILRNNDVVGATGDNKARLSISSATSGDARIFGADAPGANSGGPAAISGGSGADFATNGASVYAEGGNEDGVTHGRVAITTRASGGTIGQVLMADGDGFAYWADLP